MFQLYFTNDVLVGVPTLNYIMVYLRAFEYKVRFASDCDLDFFICIMYRFKTRFRSVILLWIAWRYWKKSFLCLSHLSQSKRNTQQCVEGGCCWRWWWWSLSKTMQKTFLGQSHTTVDWKMLIVMKIDNDDKLFHLLLISEWVTL